MSSVLKREEEDTTGGEHPGGGHVMTEAETGVILPQVNKCLVPLYTEESKKDSIFGR